MRRFRERNDLALIVTGERSAHDIDWALVAKLPWPLAPREALGREICFADASGDLVQALVPSENEENVDYGANIKAVRIRITRIVR
jgi:hypothetical protein